MSKQNKKTLFPRSEIRRDHVESSDYPTPRDDEFVEAEPLGDSALQVIGLAQDLAKELDFKTMDDRKLKEIEAYQIFNINNDEAPAKRKAFGKGLQVFACKSFACNEHSHTDYSVLDGISSPAAMVNVSARRGFGGITITDHGEMGAVLKAAKDAKAWDTFRNKLTGKVCVGRQFEFKDSSGQIGKELLAYAEATGSTLVDADGNAIPLVANDKKGLADSTFIPAEFVDAVAKNGDKKQLITISHDAESHEARSFRIMDNRTLESTGAFKIISGCELYVSWENEAQEHYNHITAMATGQHGHEVLTMLNSVGSLPSRRYIGRGYWKPRVFVEDIATALKEAKNELMVTTGCPLSIVSKALAKGDLDRAREFFAWGKANVPEGNFFAELHLCDVSLEWNPFFEKAEDAYYTRVLGAYVGRLLRPKVITDSLINSAIQAARESHARIRSYFLSSNESQSFVNSAEATFLTQAEVDVGDNRNLINRGDFSIFKELGSDFNPRRDLSPSDKQDCATMEKMIERMVSEVFPVVKDDKKPLKVSQTFDEDTKSLLEYVLRVLSLDKKSLSFGSLRDSLPYMKIYARFVLSILAEVYHSDSSLSKPVLSGRDVVAKILNNISSPDLTKNRHELGDEIRLLSVDAMLGFDGFLTGSRDTHITESLCRVLLSTFMFVDNEGVEASVRVPSTSFEGETVWNDVLIGPKGGLEDEVEREFEVQKAGNWMERVNYWLVRLAREYDVPLIMATDSHMTYEGLFEVQTALIRRGKSRAWSMTRPYFVPRSSPQGFLQDTAGVDYLAKGVISVADVVEAFGGGALLLEKSKSVSSFSWPIAVPKIRYSTLPTFDTAKEMLDTGFVRDFLPKDGKWSFPDDKINIGTALVLAAYFENIDTCIFTDTDVYRERITRELFLLQVAPGGDYVDYFLFLQKAIFEFRKAGVYVGPGRGSAAGMLTAFVCGITQVDPVKHGLSDSRWMNTGRKLGSQPDIDVDVSNRQIAGVCMAKIAQEAFEDSVLIEPLTTMEKLLVSGMYYASEKLDNEAALSEENRLAFISSDKNDLVARSRFASKLRAAMTAKSTRKNKKDFTNDNALNDEAYDHDNLDKLDSLVDSTTAIFQSPICRVGTHQSLKCKAAIKEAIRIYDATPYEALPPSEVATPEWIEKNRDSVTGLSDDEVNALFEKQKWAHLSLKEQVKKRRVAFANKLTQAIHANVGLARLYRSELDYFNGGVYAVTPYYFEADQRPPTGCVEAQEYFDENPHVKQMVLSMLNINKAPGVHAGGVIIGRELLRRIPLRPDGFGFVSQNEMKEVEAVGCLKFDILGLSNLNFVGDTLKLIIDELPYEKVSWWLTDRSLYEKVKSGEVSTDLIWRLIPKSTKEAAAVLVKERAMIFQVDTKVFAKEIDSFPLEAVLQEIAKGGETDRSLDNHSLPDFLSALLALFRPGPMKLGEHVNYLKRYKGEADWEQSLIDPWLKQFVSDTFGVIAYQEQVMLITQFGANLTLAEADNCRRAMGKKDRKALDPIQARFKTTLAETQGMPEEISQAIWDLVIPFAEYGFNRAHSYCYGIISAMTLFLKAHYKEQFFTVVMGEADPKDGARFLAEIHNRTRFPCVLRSDDTYWRVITDKETNTADYFPSFVSIEKLPAAAVTRILKTREGVENPTQMSGKEWFARFGTLTESLASSLAKAGLFRVFGGPDEVAAAYEQALVEHILPAERDRKAAAKGVAASSIDDDDESASSLSLFTDEDSMDLNALAAGAIKTKPSAKNKVVKEKKIKALIVGVKHKKVIEILRQESPAYCVVFDASDSSEIGDILTVQSALSVVMSSRIKGLGVNKLQTSLRLQELTTALEQSKIVALRPSDLAHYEPAPLEGVTAQRLLSAEFEAPILYCIDEGSPKKSKTVVHTYLSHLGRLPHGVRNTTFRVVGIPKSISENINPRNNAKEYRVVFMAEGTEFAAKFSPELASGSRLQELIELVKNAKNKLPLIVDIYAGEFTPNDRDRNSEPIKYYKIENLRAVNY